MWYQIVFSFALLAVCGTSFSFSNDRGVGAFDDTTTFDGGMDFGCPTQGCEPPGTGQFGCPTQGCEPPGTGQFGCPTQGCEPPGTGQFGCPTQGCVVNLPSFRTNQIIQAADGTNYRVASTNTLVDQNTGRVVRIQSIVNGIIYLSDGNHVFIASQPSNTEIDRPTDSTVTTVPSSQPAMANRIAAGDYVTPIRDAFIYVGKTVPVKKIYANANYKAYKIQGSWVLLIDAENKVLSGWAQIQNLRKIDAHP